MMIKFHRFNAFYLNCYNAVIMKRAIRFAGSNNHMNYYEILGLKSDCTIEDIRESFARLSKEHHPDVSSANSNTRFQNVMEAYRVLSREETRAKYDTQSGGQNEWQDLDGDQSKKHFCNTRAFHKFQKSSQNFRTAEDYRQFDKAMVKIEEDKQNRENQAHESEKTLSEMRNLLTRLLCVYLVSLLLIAALISFIENLRVIGEYPFRKRQTTLKRGKVKEGKEIDKCD